MTVSKKPGWPLPVRTPDYCPPDMRERVLCLAGVRADSTTRRAIAAQQADQSRKNGRERP